MECDSNLRRGTVVCKTSKIIVQTTAEAVAMQNMKLHERFQKEDKLSYAHFHHSITHNVENIPSGSSDYERSPGIETDSNYDDELVMYMSNLPAFLRKSETVQEKTFSVGVLDWGRLEKWQSSHKELLPRNTRYSMSSSNASFSFSTELSSSISSRGRSGSPSKRGMQRLTLQSHLLASPRDCDPHLFDPLCENRENCVHNLSLRRNNLNRKLLQAAETVESQNNGAVPCIGSHVEGFHGGKDVEKVPESGCGSLLESFQAPRRHVTDPEMSEKPNEVVILMPRGASKQEASESAVSRPSDSQVNTGKRTIEMSRRCTIQNVRGAHGSKFLSKIPRPISSELDLCKLAQEKCPRAMGMEKLKHWGIRQPPPLTCVPVTQSVVRTTEIRKLGALPPPLLDARLLRGSDSKTIASSEKARSSSPLRRLSHSMAKIVKNSSSKEGATGNQHDSAGSGFEKAEPLASRDISIHNKSNSAGRSRSSPLRRLLDPILKASNSHNCDNPLLKSSIPNDVLCGRTAGQPETMNLQSAKTKRDIAGCRMIHINDNSHLDKRDESVTVQALLRVASKNGLPLLTFAVDNDSDILAATMKNSSSSEKDHRGWSYTFFTIREVRKKNGGWISQGGKSKVSNYMPNFVAHMKVSDIEASTSRLLEEDSSPRREFVLLGVDKVQQEWNSPDFQPHDELAAIVTRTPMHKRLFQSHCSGDCDPYSRENSKDRIGLRNTTVILPGGSHSVPSSSGGPSSLIERWRSGGSCDCGGWDIGCKLKILSSEDHLCRGLSLGEASSREEDSFSLFFSRGDAMNEEAGLSLRHFKDKIYWVEFKSSMLSVLQAFSVSIAVLDSRELMMGVVGR